MTAAEDPRGQAVLVLRLAAPLQSWGYASAFNRRETRPEPTKSGIVGLLAAAQGRAREDDISDLAALRLGVRVDQPGTLLRDFHTVSDYRGRPLLQSGVTAKGVQKPTSPAKYTHVTQRYYLQDAVFLAAVGGPGPLIEALDDAVRSPAFPLALGRRSCVPTQPIRLGQRRGGVEAALRDEPWQVSEHARNAHCRRAGGRPARVDLNATVDDDSGDDVLGDVPRSFDPLRRGFTRRRIRHVRLSVPTGIRNPDSPDPLPSGHDPFALLGW
ncbi:type I-E CRISPR-associated protein Cas5/CasD [Uniformispora flossi]|uniref:type I-E CRISPR-associated protein Cas5/CasD n=1 Tax=Uniformispora flossi TaxID=3390723 RepID=UPI003C3021BB